MERQFLIISLFFLFGLSGCQSSPAIVSNIDVKCNSNSLDAGCLKDIIPSIEKPEPVANNVWDYMIINKNDKDIFTAMRKWKDNF